MEGEHEKSIVGIALIDERHAVDLLAQRQFFAEIKKLGLYRRCFAQANAFQQCTFIFAVGGNRCDDGFFDFFQCAVYALPFIDANEVVFAKMLADKALDVLFCDLCLSVELQCYVAPALVVNKRVYHEAGAQDVVL